MTTLTRDKMEEVLRIVEQLGPSDFMGWVDPYHGLRIFESNLLPQTVAEEYEVEVTRTIHERWLEPLLHPVTLPFEPWVKTRWETRIRQVPNKTVYQVGDTLFMTPQMRTEVFRSLT